MGPRHTDPAVNGPLGAQVRGRSPGRDHSASREPPAPSPACPQDEPCNPVPSSGGRPRGDKRRGRGSAPGLSLDGFPLSLPARPQQPRQWTSARPGVGGGSLSLKAGSTPKTLTHCGRRPRGPGCLRSLSCRCVSCPGSSSVQGTGPPGPEGAGRGRPGAVGCPVSRPPGRGRCGHAERQLAGEGRGQGQAVCPELPAPGGSLGPPGPLTITPAPRAARAPNPPGLDGAPAPQGPAGSHLL